MTTLLQCESNPEICQNNLLLTPFLIELKKEEVESPSFKQKYIISKYGLELVWSIRYCNERMLSNNSLFLESCNSNSIVCVKVIVINSAFNKSRMQTTEVTMCIDDLKDLPMNIVYLRIDGSLGDNSYTTEIQLKIYSHYENFLQSIDDISKNYGHLLENKQSTDVVLIVGAEKFAAHKLILSTRSNVFAAMFNCDMKEKHEGIVKIKDIEPATFKLLLEFIYKGQIVTEDDSENNSKKNEAVNWSELLLAADKYDIQSLKLICAKKLAENLNTDNVIETYILSDRVKEPELKKVSLSFIMLKKNEVVNSETYQERIKILRSFPDLAVELLSQLLEEKDSF